MTPGAAPGPARLTGGLRGAGTDPEPPRYRASRPPDGRVVRPPSGGTLAVMTGATREQRSPGQGRFRRFLERLSSSEEDLRSAELREEAEGTGCTRISDCADRDLVRVTGTLRTVTLRPRAGVPTLEAELFDGSAALDVVWLGRRSIAGIEPGRKLIVWGRITASHGRPVMFNPKYELRPLGQE